MKYLSFLLLIVLVAAAGCQSTPAKPYNKNGVSFTCPSGWKITEEEVVDPTQNAHYICMERDGVDASGIVTMTWLDGDIGLDEMLAAHIDEMKSNPIYENANVKFAEAIDSKYHQYAARVVNYTMSLLMVAHRGSVYAFHAGGKTFCILKQEATEDESDNADGFQSLESSFAVR